MSTIVYAKSSSGGEPYKVEFSVDGECVRVFCHCPAGIVQQMCKHKAALISGIESMLANVSDAVVLSEIRAWPQFKKLEARANRFTTELQEIEKEKSALAARERATKSQFARELTFGKYGI